MADATTYHNALPVGSMLLEYRLDSVLGAGGFGMTYLGWDVNLEKHVAIKEYLPTDLAVRALDGSVVPITTELMHDYKWGLDRFILEARTLAKFSHPHIVRVMRFFEANSTGYMVMEYEKGEPLNQLLKRSPQPDEAPLKAILMPLLDGLEAVHSAGFLHRDIKPGNIFLRENGSPVLIDFGAARHAIGGATKSLTSVLTPGYAPLEQYSKDGNQGPWSDIYAMAGVLYRALANDNPPDAVSRLKNDTISASLAPLRGRVSQPFLRAVEWALLLDEKQRPQSVAEWRRALLGGAAPTVRSDTVSVPTVISQPTSRPQPRPPAQPESSGFRWLGIGALVLVVLFALGAWNKHRNTERVAAEQGKSVAATSPADKPGFTRDRPSRERDGRPGGPDLEELMRKSEQDFRSADANSDGYLDQREIERFPGIKKEFNRVDADGDGRVSQQEFMRARGAMARKLLNK